MLWVSDQRGNVYRSDDQGRTFALLPAWPRNDFPVVVDPFNASIILGYAHRSADGGATWQPLSLARGGTVRFDGGVPGRAIAMSSPGSAGFVAKLDPTGQKILFAKYLSGPNGASPGRRDHRFRR